jgi:hypothetical protein
LNWTKDRLLAYPSGRDYLNNINQKKKKGLLIILQMNEMNKAKTILGGWLGQTHTQGVGNELVSKTVQENKQDNYRNIQTMY